MNWKIPGTRRTRAIGAGAVVTTAALVAGGVAVANSAGAAEASTTKATASTRAQLIEMRTAGAKGYFYTSNQAEFLRAKKLAFKFSGQVPGYVSTVAARGTVPLFRLRMKSGSSYLLTVSTAERNKLAASGSWVYEGVIGRIPLANAAGRVKVYRVSKNGVGWRVLRTADASAAARAGWRVDGILGYLWTSK